MNLANRVNLAQGQITARIVLTVNRETIETTVNRETIEITEIIEITETGVTTGLNNGITRATLEIEDLHLRVSRKAGSKTDNP